MSIGHLYVLFGEVSIQVLCPFFNSVVCFYGVELYKVVGIVDINLLSDVSVNMFSHPVGCPFILLMVSFAVQKHFSLMKSHLFFLLFLLPEEMYQKTIAMSNVRDFTAYALFYDFYGFGPNI